MSENGLGPIGLEYAESQGLSLFPFQKRGVALAEQYIEERRVESGNGRGGVLIFDEMGLGKTMEALALLARMDPRPKRVLVICPSTIKVSWKNQILTWLPPEEVAVFATGRGGLGRFRGLLKDEHWLTAPTRIFVTNYETLRSKSYMEILQAFNPQVIIFDEAHRLRNWSKKTAEAARSISAETEILLTGSPIVNHAGDLWSLVHRVSSGLAGTALNWESTFTHQWGYGRYSRRAGTKNTPALKELLSKVAVQRKKEEVLKDLPEKLYREVPLDMVDKQRYVYEQMESELFVALDEEGATLSAPSILAQLTRLRQLCSDPRVVGLNWAGSVKTDFLLELIEDELGTEQLVVFSNFEQVISQLGQDLTKRNVSFSRLTGKENSDQRGRNIERFWAGDTQIMLGTTAAGGEGVNLQCAQRVVLFDKWWSPARNEQAIDRLHRIGQLGSVEVILPHCVESIEDAMNEILKRKLRIITDLRVQSDVIDLLRDWRQNR